MSRGSIRLSEKFGVNPSLSQCFFCGGDKNEIILAGRLRGADRAAPHRAVWNTEPCDTCKGHMAQGVMLIEARHTKDGPFRTGKLAVLKDDAIRRLVKPPELVADMLRRRCAFIEPSAWEYLQLPIEGVTR